MEIVIDIPKEIYTRLMTKREARTSDVNTVYFAIAAGTPLPEHHGRIIDESQIRHIECHTERELYGNKIRYVKTTDAPTIIEGSESK